MRQTAGILFVQFFTVKVVRRLEKVAQNLGNQLVDVDLSLFRYTVRNACYTFVKAAVRFKKIDSHSDDHSAESGFFRIVNTFRQYSAYLFTVDQNVVNPLYFALLSRQFFHRMTNCDSHRNGKVGYVFNRPVRL